MARTPRLAVIFACLSPMVSSGLALAVPTLDSEGGVYADPLTDGTGLSSFTDAVVDPALGLVVLDSPATTGQFTTKDINPAALSAWGHLSVKGTGALSAEVFANGTWSNLALEPFAADGFTHRASLAIAAAHKPIRVRISFGANGPLAPGVDALKLTWSPQTTIQVAAQNPGPTLCSGASATWRFPISVSNVSANGLVAWVALPAGTLSPDFGQDARLRFISATHGGQVNSTGAPLLIHGVSVPAGAVYWNLGTTRYGSSFPLSLTAQIPNGTLDGTSYSLTVTAQATNSGAAVTATSQPTVASATPSLRVNKSLTGVYRIGDEDRAELGSTIGYRLTVTNDFSPTCRATARNLVLWDPLGITTTPGNLAPYASTPTLGAGLAPTGGGTTAYGPGPSQTGVVLPGNAAFALIPSLAPGESRSFDITVPLSNNAALANERLTNVAFVDSGYVPHAGPRQGSATFRFGIDYTPYGIYAKGENIRGSAAISAASNDNAFLNVGYGETFKYLLSVRNNGASVLDTTTLFDKLPAEVELIDAWAPAGATVYYHTGGATLAEGSPPDYDRATGTLTLGAGQWVTTRPANPTWVAVTVPRVGSPVIPTNNFGAPLSVTAELTVRVRPSATCSTMTIRNPGYFHTAFYRDGSNTKIEWDNLGTVNAELTQVVVQVPSFASAWASVTPNQRSGSGPLDYTVSFTNSLPGASNLTDTATAVVVRVDLPTTSIGGVVRPLDLIDVVAGGTIDDSGLPNYFEVTYPDVAPGGQVVLQVKTSAPRGVVDGGTATLRATIRYADVSPGACPVGPNTASATATFDVEPYLQIDKRVDFAVAGRGSQLIHTLRLVNTGEGASLDTVAFDALPRNATFVSADIPAYGQQIWFSAADVPQLPIDVRQLGEWNRSFVTTSGLFVQGVASGGVIVSPIPNPRWIAILADDQTLEPPQLPALGAPREIVFRSLVPLDAPEDALIVNEANIAARGLLPAVSNLVQTLISDAPALAISGTCVGVVAAGERLVLDYTFTNDSTNEDETATARFRLPAGVTPTALTLRGGANSYVATLPTDTTYKVSTTPEGVIEWAITDFLQGSLGSGESVSMALTVQVGEVQNGTPLSFLIGGSATNDGGVIEVGAQCNSLVENPDLRVVKLVSQTQAVSGDTLSYTLVIDNLGRRAVDNTIIRESLPAHLTLVANSISVSPSGWSIGAPFPTGQIDPLNGGAIYEWSLANNNAIDGPNSAPGAMPGLAGPIYVRFRATVGEAPAGSTLNNCAEVGVGPEPDGDQLIDGVPGQGNNRACVPLTVPHPDPKIEKTGPLTVLDGVTFDYGLTWSNQTRQAATDVIVYERIPDVDNDGTTGLELVSVQAPAGVTVFYGGFAFADMGSPPVLDPGNPVTWTTDRSQIPGPVGWVAFYIPMLPGLAVGDARVTLESTHPVTQVALPAGSVFVNCARLTLDGIDANAANNQSCVTTQIEGLNVAITKTCDPSGFLPGGRPGDLATFTLTVENRGTTTAFGIRVTDVLPSWFSLASVEPVFAEATTAGGGATAFADTSLDPRPDSVPWTRDGDTFYLGSRDGSSPLFYRQVGMFPGTRATLVFRGQITVESEAGLLASNAATVVSARVNDEDPGEDPSVLADNSSSCSFTVQRPDPMVAKTAFTADGLARAGGTITYTVGFDNLGLAEADMVIVQDEIPGGVDYIVGSLGEVPAGATLELYGPEGWGYVPSAQDGQPDPLVTAWRLSFDRFPAPLDGRFEQPQTAFEQGTFEGTRWDTVVQAIVAEGGHANPSYTSPTIPLSGATLIEWLGMFARGAESGLPAPRIDVLDGSGQPILTEVTLDEGGSRSLADLDPALYPTIQLRAVFTPRPGGSGERYGDITYLDAPYTTPMNGEVWAVHGDTMAAGIAYPPSTGGGGGDEGGGGERTGRLAVWESDGFTWGEVDLGDPKLVEVKHILHLEDDTILASGYGENNNSSVVVVWEKDENDAWQSQSLSGDDYPGVDIDYSNERTVELIGDAADICQGASPCLVQPLTGYDFNSGLSTLNLWVRRPAGWEVLYLPNSRFEENYGCDIQMNPLGYIFVDCLGFDYTVMRPDPVNGTWDVITLPTFGLIGNQLRAAYLSEVSAEILAVDANSSLGVWTSQLVRFSENPEEPTSWDLELLASHTGYFDYVMNLGRGGPLGRFAVFMDDGTTKAIKVWGPDGTGGYTSVSLPNSQPGYYFDDIAMGADGTIVARRLPTISSPLIQGARVLWRPTGPGLGDYTELVAPNHYQFFVNESRVADTGFGYQYDPYFNGSYVPLEAYVPGGPTGISTYYTALPGSDVYTTLRASGLTILGGAIDETTSGNTYSPAIFSTTSTLDLVMEHTKLPTPGLVKGRILAGTPDGCLLGEVDTSDGNTLAFAWTQVNGAWTATELTDLNGYTDLKFVVASPEHRLFGTALSGGNRVVVEFECVTGQFFASQLPIDGYDSANLFGFKNGLLYGNVGDSNDTNYDPSYGVNAMWSVPADGTTRLLLRELDGITPRFDPDVSAPFEVERMFPWSEHGLIFGNIESAFATTFQAFVWEPIASASGLDDFTLVELPAPAGAVSTRVVDYDGEGRLLGTFMAADFSQNLVVWTRSAGVWSIAKEFPGRQAINFLGMGPDAPIMAYDGMNGLTTMIEAAFQLPVAPMETSYFWSRSTSHDPADPQYTPPWVRRMYDDGHAVGFTSFGQPALFSPTSTGYTDNVFSFSSGRIVGRLAPGRFLFEDGSQFGVIRITATGYMTYDYFQESDFNHYGPYAMGDVGPDGVFWFWQNTYNWPHQYAAWAFVPDANEPTGYRPTRFDLSGQTTTLYVTDGFGPDFGFDRATPPGRLLGNGCWSIPELDVNGSLNGVDTLGSELSNLRLWGCPVEAGEPEEALSSWGVSYRSDERPSVSFQVRVEDICQRNIENTATVSTSTPQLSTGNDSASVTTPVENADLAFELDASATTIAVTGDRQVTLTGTVTNRGPHTARDLEAEITLPQGMTFVSGNTTLSLATLAPNTSTTLTVVAELDTPPDTTYLVKGGITSPTIDCTSDNDLASLSLLSGDYPDLRVTKTGPSTVQVGVPFTWTVGWENVGNEQTGPFTVTDTLPSGLGPVTASSGTLGASTVTWSNQDLAPGASTTATLTSTVNTCAAIGQTLTNRIAAPLAGDANPNDNSAAHSVLVLPPPASVEVALVQSQAIVQSGDAVFYTAHFRSTGAAVAEDAVLEIALPTAPLPGFHADALWSGGFLRYPLPDLAPGQSGSFTFALGVTDPTTVTAQVVPGSNSNVCDSAASSVNTITSGESLSIFKTADRNAACSGEIVTWTILVSNPTGADHDELVVTDQLTAGNTLVAGSLSHGGTVLPDGSLRWSLGTLASGAHRALTFQTVTPAATGTLLINSAQVSSRLGSDPVVAESNTAALRIDCGLGLVATKSIALSCEDPIRATITLGFANRGPTPLTNAVLEDSYTSLGLTSIDPDHGGTNTGSALRYTLGTLAPGQTGTRTYTVSLGAGLGSDGQLRTGRATLTADGVPMQTSNQAGAPIRFCDDGDVCTTNVCTEDGCEYLPIPNCGGCQDDSECDDGNACTDDVCNAGTCENQNDDTNTCDGGDLCQTWQCVAGTCEGQAIDCEDGFDCTVDSCDPGTGECNHDDDLATCDGYTNECVTAVCDPQSGSADPTTGCVLTADVSACTAELGNVCITTTCDLSLGCLYDPNTAPCSDGDDCTLTDVCSGGACQPGDPLDCDDGATCTSDFCQAGACQHVINPEVCSGNECTSVSCDPLDVDADAVTGCVVSSASDALCDDDNPCTTDVCSPTEGCINTNNTLPCSDGDACTIGDVCSAGVCAAGPELECDDGHDCTVDSCVEGTCENQPDDNQCPGNECATGACDPAAPGALANGCVYDLSNESCDDQNPCTDESCSILEGCVVVEDDTNTCEDGDACTENDRCEAGTCAADPIVCDDNATCTSDACVAGECVFTPVTGVCVDSECASSVCDPNDPTSDATTGCVVTVLSGDCDDDNPCTIDTCDAETGACVHTPNEGAACDDAIACTGQGVCDEAGVCTPGAPDDGFCGGLGGANPCRAGVCDPDSPSADADGCVGANAPFGTILQSDIPCGENGCALGTGDLICDGEGNQVSTCDPAYQGVSDIGDDQCVESPLVVYALITDPQTGALRGSVRCLSTAGVITCETEGTDPSTGLPLLKVYDELLCPGTPPIIANP